MPDEIAVTPEVEKPKEKDPLRRDEIEKALDEYERQIAGLPKIDHMEAPDYLTMNLEEIRKKDVVQLSEGIFKIHQYSLFIQRLINKNKAWERWARSKLDELAVSYLDDVPSKYGSFERTMIAKNRPELCKLVNQFARKVGMEIERLNGVPDQLSKLADSVKDIKFSIMARDKAYNKGD